MSNQIKTSVKRNENIYNLLPLIICSALLLVGLSTCKSMLTYTETDSPVYSSNEQFDFPANDTLRVVTFNIKESVEIDGAIETLKSSNLFRTAHVYLLQEMDQAGVQKIADALELNYLYYPLTKDENNFGNAILSVYPLANPRKLLLPHLKKSARMRGAAIASIKIAEKEILIYSAHTATIATSRKKREAQIECILKDVEQQQRHYDHILVGGDFNTLLAPYRRYVVNSFASQNLKQLTADSGPTSSYWSGLLSPTIDHIFGKKMEVLKVQTISDSEASDHFPLAVEVVLK